MIGMMWLGIAVACMALIAAHLTARANCGCLFLTSLVAFVAGIACIVYALIQLFAEVL
jgi:hypothetical protein